MKISVIVTSYNQAPYIEESLASAITNMQDVRSKAMCTLYYFDDCSTDDTYERGIALLNQRLHADQFCTEKNKSNLGICENYRKAMSSVKGDYLAFLEGDDIWSDGYLSGVIDSIKGNNQPDLIWTLPTLYIANKTTKLPIEQYVEKVRKALIGNFDKPLKFRKRFIEFFPMNLIPTFSGVTCKRAAIQKLDYMPPITKWLDYWLWSQVIPRGTAICSTKSQYQWRITASSLNNDNNRPKLNPELIELFEQGVWKYLHRSSIFKPKIKRFTG